MCYSLFAVTGITKTRAYVTRVPGRNLYLLTPDGQSFAIFYTKAHNRVLRPIMAVNRPQAPPHPIAAMRTIEHQVDTSLAQARLPVAD